MESLIRGILHGIFEKLFSKYSVEDLKNQIRDNNKLIKYAVDDRWKSKTLKLVNNEIVILKKFRWAKENILREIEINYIGSIIKDERPDLFETIIHYKNGISSPMTSTGLSIIGIKWLQQQVNDVREWLGGII